MLEFKDIKDMTPERVLYLYNFKKTITEDAIKLYGIMRTEDAKFIEPIFEYNSEDKHCYHYEFYADLFFLFKHPEAYVAYLRELSENGNLEKELSIIEKTFNEIDERRSYELEVAMKIAGDIPIIEFFKRKFKDDIFIRYFGCSESFTIYYVSFIIFKDLIRKDMLKFNEVERTEREKSFFELGYKTALQKG